MPRDEKPPCESWGLDNVGQTAAWARQTQKRLRELGEKLGAGAWRRSAGLACNGIGRWQATTRRDCSAPDSGASLPKEKVDQTMKHIFTKWVS